MNGYDVKSTELFSPARVQNEIPASCTRDSALFVKRDRIRTIAMLVAFTVFYFDKNNNPVILHDQINFTKPAGEIPLQ